MHVFQPLLLRKNSSIYLAASIIKVNNLSPSWNYSDGNFKTFRVLAEIGIIKDNCMLNVLYLHYGKIILVILCIFLFFLSSFLKSNPDKNLFYSINWDNLIHLDAEDLAEQGIKEIYEKEVIPHLINYVANPIEIEEIKSIDNSQYQVKANNIVYLIYDDNIEQYLSWGYATFALFDIVNQQLKDSDFKFYAFENGNELSGMFMSNAEYQQYCNQLKINKEKLIEIPYIPTLEPDWFGQHHN